MRSSEARHGADKVLRTYYKAGAEEATKNRTDHDLREVHDLNSISVVVVCYAVSVAVQTKPGKRVLDNSDDTDDTAA